MGGRQRTSLFMGLEEKRSTSTEERTGRERGKKSKKR